MCEELVSLLPIVELKSFVGILKVKSACFESFSSSKGFGTIYGGTSWVDVASSATICIGIPIMVCYYAAAVVGMFMSKSGSVRNYS